MPSQLKPSWQAIKLQGFSSKPATSSEREVDVVEEPATVVSGRGRFDIAAEFLQLHEREQGGYTEEEARRVLRKIDIRLIPLMLITCTLCAVDKVIISNAALYGMIADCGLVGQQYSWVASIFYFGYLVAQFPVNTLTQKLPVGKLIGVAAASWATVVVLMGACSNAAGLMTLRFLMGIFEAPMFPVCAVMTVMWYKKKEQPLRVAIWFGQFSSLISGIVSYGIGHTSTAIAPWRLLFIVLGGFTLLWGILLYFYMPDSPIDCKFLNDREKYIAVHRIKENMTGIQNKTIKLYQVREAFTDWKTWPLAIYCFCTNIPNGGLTTFSAQIVSGLGYSALETTLLGMPTGVLSTTCAILVTIPASRLKNMRCIVVGLWALIPLTCCILIMKLPTANQHGRLAAYYSFYSYWGGYATVTSIPMANTSGHTKKVTRNAIMFLSFCLGNIVAPQFFITSEAPDYKTGYRAILASISISIVCCIVYGVGVYLENRKTLKNLQGEDVHAYTEGEEALLDQTDKEKKGFIYIY